MEFSQLVEKVNNVKPQKIEALKDVVDDINITFDEIDELAEVIFSDEIEKFNMEKLPYLIDELYKSDDPAKVILSCMLLESACKKLPFITNLEEYRISPEKFELIKDTLICVYEQCDNGIGICMVKIILLNDQTLDSFNDEEKAKLAYLTKNYLTAILNYWKEWREYLLKNNPETNMDEEITYILEILADFACEMDDEEISGIIDEIDKMGSYGEADLFITKYKFLHYLELLPEKITELSNPKSSMLVRFYQILEAYDEQMEYLKDVTQEEIACSDMIRWLEFPTELGEAPDSIECLGEIVCDNQKFYAFAFEQEGYYVEGKMMGVSGGYPIDRITSNASGYTFSKLEPLEDDWKSQALSHVRLIGNHWEAGFDEI